MNRAVLRRPSVKLAFRQIPDCTLSYLPLLLFTVFLMSNALRAQEPWQMALQSPANRAMMILQRLSLNRRNQQPFENLTKFFSEVESELDPTQSCQFEGNSQRWLHTSGWVLVRHRRPLTSSRLIASANREMRFISPDTALNGRQHRRNQARLCQSHRRHRSRRIPAGTRDSS